MFQTITCYYLRGMHNMPCSPIIVLYNMYVHMYIQLCMYVHSPYFIILYVTINTYVKLYPYMANNEFY